MVKSPCTMLELCMSAINSPISLATLMASGHLRLRFSPAAGSTGSISPNLARMMLQLGPFVGSILPPATATATATGSLLLVVGISVGRKVGLLLLSLFCRDGATRRRRPFQVFSDGAALDMLQVNARRGDGRSGAFDHFLRLCVRNAFRIFPSTCTVIITIINGTTRATTTRSCACGTCTRTGRTSSSSTCRDGQLDAQYGRTAHPGLPAAGQAPRLGPGPALGQPRIEGRVTVRLGEALLADGGSK